MAFMLGAANYKVLLNGTYTTTTTGTAADLAGFVEPGNSQCVAFLTGTARTYTGSPTVTVTIAEDDTSGMTSPTTVATFTAIATTAATNEMVGVTITKRYVQSTATFSADTTTGAYSVVLVGTKRTV